MSYAVYDSRGYVTDVASGGGWSDFRDAVELDSPGPETKTLIAEGSSDDPEALFEELRKASFPNESADSVRKMITHAASKCQDVVIVTDGVGIEEDSA
jgi:hypothetical protein